MTLYNNLKDIALFRQNEWEFIVTRMVVIKKKVIRVGEHVVKWDSPLAGESINVGTLGQLLEY